MSDRQTCRALRIVAAVAWLAIIATAALGLVAVTAALGALAMTATITSVFYAKVPSLLSGFQAGADWGYDQGVSDARTGGLRVVR